MQQVGIIRNNNLTRFDKKKAGGKMKKKELTGKVLSGDEIITILAKRVIKGDYGTGDERVKKLGKLYLLVQKKVNELSK